MKYYKTQTWSIEITPVEVDRVTDKSVYIDGSRCQSLSNYEAYHPTWEAAKQWYITRAQSKIERLERQLRDAKDELAEAELLKP